MSPTSPPPPPGGTIHGADLAFSIVLTVVFYLFGMAAVGMFLAPGGAQPAALAGTSGQVMTLAQLAVMSAALLGAVYVVVIRRRGQSWSDLGYVQCDRTWIRRAVLLGVALLPVLMMVGYIVRNAMPAADRPDLGSLIAPRDLDWFVALVTLVYGGLVTPIAEEIFFRGMVYGWLRRRMGFAVAAPLAAAAFGLLHQRPDAIVAAFAIGLVLSWLYEKSGSLLPAITLHQVINTTQLSLLYLGAAARPATG